ncbi:glucose PTS transporter subunit IIA [Spiroplasma monobiae]|uniref:PTS system, beta-glucoside-specific IIABC component n=1 Tax=Spiroplasma monobiae MQ-1 TaxID=1336748 RepID=A0A2K9LUJ3_SPISQ|nr:glucose PTS transporter subunit IIA [Spiroplasma monobiae]AUM62723.1 PTS system, beta-glucoside-specific IIABC component [Spiroplasma monobiae MQ-1]
MEINLYAPVDCEVKHISKCSDAVFSEKMLGDGIVVIPENGKFSLPFDKAKCKMTFETKHAYGFKINNELDVLIHCGIDTVKLNGKPFTQKVKLEQNLKLNDAIFEVDLQVLKDNNVTSETPIVFDPASAEDIQILGLKEGKYKKGELICKISYKQVSPAKSENGLKEFKSKYQLAGEHFVNAVGGRANYSRVYNCMTRLRFNINDKSKVDEAKIKSNELVKGINWAGDELQIIIGGECYKVREEIEKLDNYSGSTKETKDKVKKSVGSIIMEAIAGIMVPIIPVLMAVGIFGALYAITNQIGWTQNLDDPTVSIENANLLSVIMFILQKVGLNLIGVFFLYNTVKYLNGNTILAIFAGLILTSRILFVGVLPTGTEEWSFGQLMSETKYGISGWFLFRISDYPVVIKAYEGSVLPFILAGFIIAYSDKWIKTWMPSSIDIVFRSAIVIFLTVVPVLFIAGPILGLLEYLMVILVNLLGAIPFGIGVALFTIIWQPLVLTGVHVAVAMTMMLPIITSATPSPMLPAVTIAVMGQLGTVIGIAIFTKNGNLRGLALNAIPAGVFGITEPIIYGINLPKVKPFIIGCLSGGVGGLICGYLGVVQNSVGPQGILAVLNYDEPMHKVILLLSFLATIGTAILLTFFFYKERKNEYKVAVDVSKKIEKLLKKMNSESLEWFEKNSKDISLQIKDKKEVIKEYEKYLQKLLKLEAKIAYLNGVEEKTKAKLYKKATKAQVNEKLEQEKIDMIVERYNSYSLTDKINPLVLEKENLIKDRKDTVKNYESTVKELENATFEFVENISKEVKKEEILEFKNLYWNAVNAVEVGYGVLEEKKIYFTKEQKRNLLAVN